MLTPRDSSARSPVSPESSGTRHPLSSSSFSLSHSAESPSASPSLVQLPSSASTRSTSGAGHASPARLALPLAITILLFCGTHASAQDACRTVNCAPPGSVPAECQNRATPVTLQVNFTGTTLTTYAFTPNSPKIEEGDCILWSQGSNTTHNSSHSACMDDPLCMVAPVVGCKWDTGNVSTATNPSRTCSYTPASFPGSTSATGVHFYCRIHASPSDTTGMVGDLRVTTKVVLTAQKSGASVDLSWTGGGVTGDFTYDVLRSLNDPRFNRFTTLATGSIASFTDATAVTTPGLYSYYVRNKNN